MQVAVYMVFIVPLISDQADTEEPVGRPSPRWSPGWSPAALEPVEEAVVDAGPVATVEPWVRVTYSNTNN